MAGGVGSCNRRGEACAREIYRVGQRVHLVDVVKWVGPQHDSDPQRSDLRLDLELDVKRRRVGVQASVTALGAQFRLRLINLRGW